MIMMIGHFFTPILLQRSDLNMPYILLNFEACLVQNFLEDGPLHSIHWFRVVLDEAHTIKAFRSNSSQAVFQLTADRRWCLTGTPIQVLLGPMPVNFKMTC
jgi:SNF2 family DNA or RNA helicase